MIETFADPVAAHGWETGEALDFGSRRERPRPVPAWRSIDRLSPWLTKAMEAASLAEPASSPAAEWVLDNGYHIQRAMLLVRDDMPPGFYARLRPLRSGAAAGEPRVLMLAHDLLEASHFQLSRENVLAYLEGYQSHSALDIAELWAFPTMLRIACIERLVTGFAAAFRTVPAPFRTSESCGQFMRSVEPADCVARAIANLAVISNIIWKEIFDESCHVDRVLARDPSGTFPKMDFDTRDACRQSVERLADLGAKDEVEIAEAAIGLAHEHGDLPFDHVGYWLIAHGVVELERTLGIGPSAFRRLGRWLMHWPGAVYAFALFLCGLAGLALPVAYLALRGANTAEMMLGIALAALPATVLSVTLVNWLVTLVVPAKQLPKLDFSEGIDPNWPTVIVLPVIVGSIGEVAGMLSRLESHFLANPGARGYVLLSDPADASREHVPGDEAIEEALRLGVRRLNRERGAGFCLLHRARRYNDGQECWMAWERKRGKLEQFNQFILTGDRTAFPVSEGDIDRLAGAKFVVTADADTRLPTGAVARLAGTLAHPLNRPLFDDDGRVRSGYTVLQPRVEIAPHGRDTLFARLFGGDTAIDIYSRAVSDVYQDLIGTGNFVGKGIYDVAAFARSLDGRIPENQLLSHDLWEGLHGRAGLASDIIVYESYPESYAEYVRRWHRWVRGDWQLLPWLFSRVPGPGGTRIANRLSLFDRLRIWDNMRRSLVPLSVLLLLLGGWFVLPGSPLFWTAMALLVPSAWLFTDLVTGVARGRRRGVLMGTMRQAREHIERWALQIVFLLSDTVTAIHAIGVTLLRLRRGRKLLEWTSAAHVSHLLARSSARSGQWAAAWSSPLLATGIGALFLWDASALPVATPLLLLWFLTPEIAWLTARPRLRTIEPLDLDDRLYLRRVARRSWLYFERFAGPEDHWLPPDNRQEAPVPATAHRTSPTNIGMLALSALSAWKLGHIGSADFAGRMQAMLDTLDRLDRWNGHILNWYDTRDLAPLEPRYVSTVDSGNLAVSLVVLASGCRTVAASPNFCERRWEGLEDCLALLAEALIECGLGDELAQKVDVLIDDVSRRSHDPLTWSELIETAVRQMAEVRTRLVELLERTDRIDAGSLEAVRDWLDRCEHHLADSRRELSETSGMAHNALIAMLHDIGQRASEMAEAMDFAPLYDRHRKLFHIGYDVTSQRIDTHYYDLLASEARLASYFAIAKRDVPPEHWFQLGRPIVKQKNDLSLVSWNGSMFEYLMPSLFLRSDPATLLGETETAAVAMQISYANRHRVPWGISESGFASYGSDGIWRYRAFGVPALGLRRGLEDDLVIAPYATALALAATPHQAVANLRRLDKCGAMGRFGFHEALDFTKGRSAGGGDPVPVRSYMAHHHGMTIAAIANALEDDVMVWWFHADQRMESVDLLLNERIPWELPTELERLELPSTKASSAPLQPRPEPWELGPIERPMTALLGNGRLSLRLASDGCGDLVWKGNAVTCPTGINRDRGHFLYLREKATGHVWSPTSAPVGAAGGRRVIIHPHKLEFRCRTGAISTALDVLISSSQDVEIRRIRLINESAEHRTIDLASHADIALADLGEWSRHPAFARLFVESHSRPDLDTLLFSRRARSPDIPGLVMAQRIIMSPDNARLSGCETVRKITRGRLGPIAEFPHVRPGGADVGQFPLDPAAGFLVEIDLPPHGEAEVALVTALAPLESEALELVRRYGALSSLDWAEQDCGDSIRHEIQALELAPHRLRDAQLLFAALNIDHGPRAPLPSDETRDDLWALGVSGDFPILLIELNERFDVDELQFVLAAHSLWRRKGAQVDLVILHPGLPGYVEPLRERIYDIVKASGCEEQIGERGGITIAGSEHNDARNILALRAAATTTLAEGGGSIEARLRNIDAGRIPVPNFVATAPEPRAETTAARAPEASALALPNGFGGFTETGAYRIELDEGRTTPAPWSNVLANKDFGTIVTEAGLGFTFAGNSGENRITPWHNDALLDPQAEALYLRDEETGEVWSVTPLPAGGVGPCRIEHGTGETRWSRRSMGLEQELRCFVAPDDPVKIVDLALHNTAATPRRITATYFADWIMGTHAAEPAPFRASWYRADLGAVLGRNRWQREFRDKVSFLAGTDTVHSLTTSRSDFLGAVPDWRHPAGLIAWGLGERPTNTGRDAVAAVQFHLDIAAGETAEISFLLGQADCEDDVATILERWRAAGMIDAGRKAVSSQWDTRCGAVEVTTPDPAFDVMVNRWLPYQAMSSRVFARAGFYQASGAFGFRDQLQDVLALLLPSPQLARDHILDAASYQFEEGDVLHWWHPPSGRGVRTRCSDDLLWLPFAAARYVEATGDSGILDVSVPFLSAEELATDEHDRFNAFPRGTEASLYEHCMRAFDRAYRLGARGLPLIGDGDWNDGMNRVGSGGKGESIWLAWFLAVTIRDFANMCEVNERSDFGPHWLPRRDLLISAVEEHGWDGEWYVRAFDDHQRPVGSHADDECRIDALVQSWAVMAGGDKARANQAIDSAFRQLVRPDDRIARLLTPPFHRTPRDPGYIKAYPPGIRENGGQYSHATAWLGIACAMLGDGNRAKAVFDRINPARQADTFEHTLVYTTEPYAVAADIAGGHHLGRGGWSWYTGAAGWAWRLATEHILGITLENGCISIDPCLPSDWPGFGATVRGDGEIEIEVTRGQNSQCLVDGQPGTAQSIGFPGKGRTRTVELVLAPSPAIPAGTLR
ncbi:GH36-type glycosyl hydrolase domain-containing protein [Qipengyuania zhejiangensis]|uniref:GH36-type glycosyl hydrolase domain-containing protein n=1 Tax=Qipengyuania zhejiangensis TaxID=3077782 RepID=UPI002D792F5C|nr:glucoamylase family protein [Qipengyuania sp. Z2]